MKKKYFEISSMLISRFLFCSKTLTISTFPALIAAIKGATWKINLNFIKISNSKCDKIINFKNCMKKYFILKLYKNDLFKNCIEMNDMKYHKIIWFKT